jgi:hypothetical protein
VEAEFAATFNGVAAVLSQSLHATGAFSPA